MATNRVQAIPLKSIDSATFTGSYQAINPTGLSEACFMIRINNDSNRDLTLSYDGTTDHEYVLAGDFLQVDAQNNARPNNFTALFSKGLVVYVKASAGTGSVYLSGYYQD